MAFSNVEKFQDLKKGQNEIDQTAFSKVYHVPLKIATTDAVTLKKKYKQRNRSGRVSGRPGGILRC